MGEIFNLIQQEPNHQELQQLLKCNEKTEKYGLVLSEKDVLFLMESHKTTLKETQRVEFGESILISILYAFCDSQYLNQNNYSSTLASLTDIFYSYKNEVNDELNDMELIDFMHDQFETVCFGDLEYLSKTCLERFAKSVRSGRQSSMQRRLRDEYSLKESPNDYTSLSEEIRWEYEVYKLKLEDLF